MDLMDQKPAFAAVDIGTNAARCKIVRQNELGRIEELFDQRDAIRPGDGVFDTGNISHAASERLRDTLLLYADEAKKHNASMRAVATAAFRAAQNQEDVVAFLRDSTGVDVHVISGLEEARLVALAALSGTAPGNENAIVDIGGGSTEVILAKGAVPTKVVSIGLGALRLYEHFEKTEKITSKQLKLMRAYVSRTVRTDLAELKIETKAKSVLGTSGSIRALIRYGPSDAKASRKEVRRMIAQLVRMTLTERKKIFPSSRAEVIVGAAVILDTVMGTLGVDIVDHCSGSLRDGLLRDMLGRTAVTSDADLKTAALNLGRRYQFDEQHGAHTAHLSSLLFDATNHVNKLSERDRSLLEVAALLHDIGYAINRQKHHRHSAYLVEHTPLPGLTKREQRFVARLIRYHRRRLPFAGHDGLADLSPNEVMRLQTMIPLLRLADALDRSRNELVDDIAVQTTDKTIRVSLFAPSGAALEEWNGARQSPAFERFYGRKLEVDVVKDRNVFQRQREVAVQKS